jgi:hypothetical protein
LIEVMLNQPICGGMLDVVQIVIHWMRWGNEAGCQFFTTKDTNEHEKRSSEERRILADKATP